MAAVWCCPLLLLPVCGFCASFCCIGWLTLAGSTRLGVTPVLPVDLRVAVVEGVGEGLAVPPREVGSEALRDDALTPTALVPRERPMVESGTREPEMAMEVCCWCCDLDGVGVALLRGPTLLEEEGAAARAAVALDPAHPPARDKKARREAGPAAVGQSSVTEEAPRSATIRMKEQCGWWYRRG